MESIFNFTEYGETIQSKKLKGKNKIIELKKVAAQNERRDN